jgi:hypothetical protein
MRTNGFRLVSEAGDVFIRACPPIGTTAVSIRGNLERLTGTLGGIHCKLRPQSEGNGFAGAIFIVYYQNAGASNGGRCKGR